MTGSVGLKKNPGARSGLQIFNISTRQLEKTLPLNLNPVAADVSPDGTRLAVVSAGLPNKDESKSIPPMYQLYDLTQGALLTESRLDINPSAVHISPDSSRAFVLTAGYPNFLADGYPQLKQDSPVWGSVSAWDVATGSKLWSLGVGYGARDMNLARDGESVYLTSVFDGEMTAMRVGVNGGIRTTKLEGPAAIIPEGGGRLLYLLGPKQVTLLDIATWSVVGTILHTERLGLLKVGELPDGRWYLFEREKFQLHVYDPQKNQTTSVPFVSPGSQSTPSVFSAHLSDLSLEDETVQVVGDKMYLLPYASAVIYVVDLRSLSILKRIPVQMPSFLVKKSTAPEALYHDAESRQLLAVSSWSGFSMVPISEESDEALPGFKASVSEAPDGSLGSWLSTMGGSYEPFRAGPSVDLEHHAVHTTVGRYLYTIDTVTGQSRRLDLGKGTWVEYEKLMSGGILKKHGSLSFLQVLANPN